MLKTIKPLTLSLVIATTSVLLLTGSDDYKGKSFIGHWYQITKSKHPNDISISESDGDFHISENRFYPVGLAAYRMSHSNAKAESDTILNGINFSMIIKDNQLIYNNETYIKK